MFIRTGPQRVEDKQRHRAIWHPSRFECRYEREGRSVTLMKEGYLTIQGGGDYIPAGTDINIPKRAMWGDTQMFLSPDEHAEMIADLIAGYAAMQERLTLLDSDDVLKILYEAEPKAKRKSH
jgi:hypothetical protein